MGKVYIGTSGFYYKSWIGKFYPKDLKQTEMFSYYTKHFNTVEINASFYRTPNPKVTENWKEKAPKDFVFTFKGSRYISHIKKFIIDKKSFDIFFKPLKVFFSTDKKHLILFQTASNFKINEKRFEDLLKFLPNKFRYAFEFRHESWFVRSVYDSCRKYNAALVLSDSPSVFGKRKWPMVEVDTADFFYIRFHGSKLLYTSAYSDKELKGYTALIKDKLKKGMSVYCYFNNDSLGYATENAKKLTEFLQDS